LRQYKQTGGALHDARVSITTGTGVHERIYADPSGEPTSFPMNAMQQKFLQLARPVLNNRAEKFADAILSLENFDRVAAKANSALLSRAGSRDNIRDQPRNALDIATVA
jgi:hypothetical protein